MHSSTDLEHARQLAELGVPLFLAQYDTNEKIRPPLGWKGTKPDPSVVDKFTDDQILCAVMGTVFDAVDVDPRNNGEDPDDLPTVYGTQTTPSGGWHHLVAPLGIGNAQHLLQGVDIRGGKDGHASGFIVLAPSTRSDGAYTWIDPPQKPHSADTSGVRLAALAAPPTRDEARPYSGPGYDALPTHRQALADKHLAAKEDEWRAKLEEATMLPVGTPDTKGRGWDKLAADCAWSWMAAALTPWTGLTIDQARQRFERCLPQEFLDDDRSRFLGKWSRGRLRNVEAEPAPQPPWEESTDKLRSGGSFIYDTPDHIPAVWGSGTDILWGEGESLLLAGGTGAGKTTISGQLIAAMLSGGGWLFGLPVAARCKVLYFAMDRPRQIARALKRTFEAYDLTKQLLDNSLVFHEGPTESDIAQNPETLRDIAVSVGADMVIVDSIKDAVASVNEDSSGLGYNRARQLLLSEGVDLLENHHMNKHSPNGGQAKGINDVSGSGWFIRGAGNVVTILGSPGDDTVTMYHEKPSAEKQLPFSVEHDHERGISVVTDAPQRAETDLQKLLAQEGPATARHIAEQWHGYEVTRNEKAAVQRKLDKLAKDELAVADKSAKETYYSIMEREFR